MAAGAEGARALVEALRRPVAVAGFGVEGRETLAFLQRHGVGGVAVYDRAFAEGPPPDAGDFPGARFLADDEGEAALADAGTVVRSPGLRPDHPALAAARARGALITSATGLFLATCPGPVAGVTGTLGKGTTVSLIAAALEAGGVPCRMGGNIGVNPLAFLEALTPAEAVVLELSSFQLMDLHTAVPGGRRPEVAVVLRTSSEHLDWHADLDEYRDAKARLLVPPGPDAPRQTVVYCADSEGSADVLRRAGVDPAAPLAVSRAGPVRDGVGVAGGAVRRYRAGRNERWAELERLHMPGAFNLENAAAAALAAEALGADTPPAREAIAAFPGLPHRLEYAGEVAGVACYNDSYATRPDATVGALQSFPGPLAAIMGGSEKHADFTALADAVVAHEGLRRVVLMGTTGPRLADAITAAADRSGCSAPETVRVQRLEAAVEAGLAALPPGGVLLFSPACASFDMFPNYKVRGERFKALVAMPSA